MIEYFASLSHIKQAFIAGLFTWGMTAAGASLVVFFKSIKEDVSNFMLGFASGVMIAASFWSLLAPGIEIAERLGQSIFLSIGVGFLSGGLIVAILNYFIPHIHVIPRLNVDEKTMKESGIKRSILLFSAMTIHNIPEGLAVGVAFGAVYLGYDQASLGAAIALAIGIGLQNFPEGFAASVPLAGSGVSHKKSFFYGQLSGVVEPIAAVVGASVVIIMHSILPFALAFAAGAMIFVVSEELIPSANSKKGKSVSSLTSYGTLGVMIGFVVMMSLDVLLA